MKLELKPPHPLKSVAALYLATRECRPTAVQLYDRIIKKNVRRRLFDEHHHHHHHHHHRQLWTHANASKSVSFATCN